MAKCGAMTARRIRAGALLGCLLALVGAWAPQAVSPASRLAAAQPSPAATLTSPPESTLPGAPAAVTSEHRIGVRVVDGAGEFYDRQTGERFVPRGYNYIRLEADGWHATLNPGFYDAERADEALGWMQAAGYNVVRILIDCCRAGSNVGSARGGLSDLYLDNVLDFLERARAHQIVVLVVLDLTPAAGGYDEMWRSCCTYFDDNNLRYLTSGGHQSKRRYIRDFVRALIGHGAPLESIFAFDLNNEMFYDAEIPPLSLVSGRVHTANGRTYDLAIPEDRQRMMDENLVYWIDEMRAAIREIDPTALVTISFPAVIGGPRLVRPQVAIEDSTADFVDLHMYLGLGAGLDYYLRSFGVEGDTAKPLLLGEFGAHRRGFPSAEAAAQALRDWHVSTCALGFDGWLMWTFDTDEQTGLYNGLSEGGVIDQALAPMNRPDPCR